MNGFLSTKPFDDYFDLQSNIKSFQDSFNSVRNDIRQRSSAAASSSSSNTMSRSATDPLPSLPAEDTLLKELQAQYLSPSQQLDFNPLIGATNSSIAMLQNRARSEGDSAAKAYQTRANMVGAGAGSAVASRLLAAGTALPYLEQASDLKLGTEKDILQFRDREIDRETNRKTGLASAIADLRLNYLRTLADYNIANRSQNIQSRVIQGSGSSRSSSNTNANDPLAAHRALIAQSQANANMMGTARPVQAKNYRLEQGAGGNTYVKYDDGRRYLYTGGDL